MESLSNILADQLEQIADKLRKGTSLVDKDTVLDCLELLSAGDKTQIMSKVEACKFMRMGRATFDSYVKMGFIPEGKKQVGLKELTWNKLELEVAKRKIDAMKGDNV